MDASVGLLLVLVRLQEIGREHRGDEPRDEQGEQHLHRDGHAELLEELTRNGGQEAHRQEYRNDRQADRDDRQTDFVGRLERRAIRRFAHLDVAYDIFDLDDGVVDENADAERNRQQGSR